MKIITYLKGYFTSKNYIEEFLVKVFNYKVKVESISYFGYLQGHKVFINGKKYPLEYGHHYTSNTIKQAVISAFNDRKL